MVKLFEEKISYIDSSINHNEITFNVKNEENITLKSFIEEIRFPI